MAGGVWAEKALYKNMQTALEQGFAFLDPADWHVYMKDFRKYDDTATVGEFAETGDASTIATTDAAGGQLSIASGGTNNNEAYVSSMHENWLFAANKPLIFEARVKLTEAATDDANIIVGLSDTVAADSLLDDGGGPMASYDGAVFFKVDGGTVWQFETSNAGTQVTDTSVGTFTSATWHKIGFYFDPNDGTTGKVTAYVDDTADTVKKNITLSGLAEMHVLLGVKAGGANAETLLVDYVRVAQAR